MSYCSSSPPPLPHRCRYLPPTCTWICHPPPKCTGGRRPPTTRPRSHSLTMLVASMVGGPPWCLRPSWRRWPLRFPQPPRCPRPTRPTAPLPPTANVAIHNQHDPATPTITISSARVVPLPSAPSPWASRRATLTSIRCRRPCLRSSSMLHPFSSSSELIWWHYGQPIKNNN